MQEILRDAFEKRYGVGAFNIVNDLTMDAVLAAAEETKSPVIVQVSVKTVRRMGAQAHPHHVRGDGRGACRFRRRCTWTIARTARCLKEMRRRRMEFGAVRRFQAHL